METTYLDTHVLIWLHRKETDILPNKAKIKIETSTLLYSPIVKLELEFLNEINRIRYSSQKIINDLSKAIHLNSSTNAFNEIIKESKKITWTRDPFDRIIVAEATINNAFLVTKDRTILKNYKKSIWN